MYFNYYQQRKIAYHRRPSRPKIPFYRRNTYIHLSPIHVINEKGENLGEMETSKALELARSRGLDLVEVAPKEKPPVCKIMSWSKFKYTLSKKSRGSSKGKSKELKEMWFSPYISDGDTEHKLKKVREFLKKKHPVKLTIRVRGRVQREVVTSQMDKILKLLQGEFETEGRPREEGRNLALIIFPPKAVQRAGSAKKSKK